MVMGVLQILCKFVRRAGNDCGLSVDPLNPLVIAQAIHYLVTHTKGLQSMGLIAAGR